VTTDPPSNAIAGGARARVYFALWPGASTLAQLHSTASDLHIHCGGRLMRADTLHLTLAFIGDIARAQIPRLMSLAGELRCPAFTLSVDRAACWERPRLVWAGPRHPPGELLDLAAQLTARLQAGGVAVDHRVFKPHVTLIRRHDRAIDEHDIAPIAWKVRNFVLVESMRVPAGVRYRTLGRVQLHCPGTIDNGA
jgi:2'-5' RNA ligase